MNERLVSEKAELEREKQVISFRSCHILIFLIIFVGEICVTAQQDMEEESLGAFSQLQEQMNAIMQQVVPSPSLCPLVSRALSVFQASTKVAALKAENDALKAQIAQLVQTNSHTAAAGSSTRSDCDPDCLDVSELATSHCSGSVGEDSRRSSCVSALESSRGSLIDQSGVTSPDASLCDDGSGDASMLSALDCSAEKLASHSVSLVETSSTSVLALPLNPSSATAIQAVADSAVSVVDDLSCGGDAGARCNAASPAVLVEAHASPADGVAGE